MVRVDCGESTTCKFQGFKEGSPERVVFVHIQYSRDTDGSTHRFRIGERFIVKDPFVFVFKQVRDIFAVLCLAQSAFTAVTGNIAGGCPKTG